MKSIIAARDPSALGALRARSWNRKRRGLERAAEIKYAMIAKPEDRSLKKTSRMN